MGQNLWGMEVGNKTLAVERRQGVMGNRPKNWESRDNHLGPFSGGADSSTHLCVPQGILGLKDIICFIRFPIQRSF